ncbi:uncharacterized protein LOC128735506 [Sabethes cyaneus]|uniref:uncharacterized protein LOC128735506 n=1 Tax=Sabethes cyaneus TaxID=53552 RepID=UPI00237D5466|nr:uncharacterized protein LOC128735506 [Sabethes cyaneus]
MWSRAKPVAVVVVLLSLISGTKQEEPQLYPSTPRKGRFLGLLGLLTGLTLVDSLDDGDGPQIRAPQGIVRINIGRPLAESFYHYMYNPYYYGSVPTVNIKIPLGFEGYDGINHIGGAPVGAGTGAFGQNGPHVIEPRPILSDSSDSIAETVHTAENLKKPRRAEKIRRSRLPYTRIIRSTPTSDVTDDEEQAIVEPVDRFEDTSSSSTASVSRDPATKGETTEKPPTLQGTAIPLIEDNTIVGQASEIPSFPIAQSYFSHVDSLQDASLISLTTSEPENKFIPSRPDTLSDSCNHAGFVADDFRPVVNV